MNSFQNKCLICKGNTNALQSCGNCFPTLGRPLAKKQGTSIPSARSAKRHRRNAIVEKIQGLLDFLMYYEEKVTHTPYTLDETVDLEIMRKTGHIELEHEEALLGRGIVAKMCRLENLIEDLDPEYRAEFHRLYRTNFNCLSMKERMRKLVKAVMADIMKLQPFQTAEILCKAEGHTKGLGQALSDAIKAELSMSFSEDKIILRLIGLCADDLGNEMFPQSC